MMTKLIKVLLGLVFLMILSSGFALAAGPDVNNDGVVNAADLIEIFQNWGLTGARRQDVSGDQKVNSVDAGYVIKNWGETVATPTPEPTAPPSSTTGWHQEAHDAQHTSYTDETLSKPWYYRWMWNGACDKPLGSTCRPNNHPDEGWTFTVPGKSHIVVGGGRLYLPAGEHGVWAIRESDGKTAWNNSSIKSYVSAAFDPETNTLFVAARNGTFYKLDSTSGGVIDSVPLGDTLDLAPTLAAGRVYLVTKGGTLYALNKKTMEVVWQYAAGSQGQTPASYSPSFNLLVFATEDLYVHGVNNSNGSQRWRVKPTVNSPGDYTWTDDDGMPYREYYYEHGWPVIAEDHGVVFVRLRLPWSSVYDVPNPPNWFPESNAAIRSFLVDNPHLQSLFALKLDDGNPDFIPAVGNAAHEMDSFFLRTGPMPIVKKLPDGNEVVYIVWRNGQKCKAGECSGPRWDAVMGEMVLDNSTVPGYQAGDLRFVKFHGSEDLLITDEADKFMMAGNTIFHTHWLATYSYRITDRSSEFGATYVNPIRTEKEHTLVLETAGPDQAVNASHYIPGDVWPYRDTRPFSNAFWALYMENTPSQYAEYNCMYAIINNGSIYYQIRSGTIFAVGTGG